VDPAVTGTVQSLPTRFPIFPLRGALLLPGGNLPLNIFEPRYLHMIRDAMRTDRIIGMIQPRGGDEGNEAPPIYGTGCAGRITNFSETPDGRFLITLTGLMRFDVAQELPAATPYRQVAASFERWLGDLQPDLPTDTIKEDLLRVLEGYFKQQGIEADWTAIRKAPIAALVTSLAMICPFDPAEKQALLEASSMGQQAELLVALMQMDALGSVAGESGLPN
jgi:uncharacterized protein